MESSRMSTGCSSGLLAGMAAKLAEFLRPALELELEETSLVDFREEEPLVRAFLGPELELELDETETDLRLFRLLSVLGWMDTRLRELLGAVNVCVSLSTRLILVVSGTTSSSSICQFFG